MKQRFLLSISVLSIVILSAACGGFGGSPAKTPQTQLQMREFQTRDYDTKDTKLVMKAMLNVLQDDGFQISNANTDLGLLSASKEVDVQNGSEKFWKTVLVGDQARWNRNATIECTANVSEFGDKTRVRVTFQQKTMDNTGQVAGIKQIDSEAYYQDFYAKVSKGLFIQKEGI